MRRAIFMDRDGTVSEEIGYMVDPSRFSPFPWTGPAIRKINESGWGAIIVTNQSGVGRGCVSEPSVHQVHARFRAHLAQFGASLDAIYYCPHHPDAGCDCRKPKPGMLLQAREHFEIELAESFVIGDRSADIIAAGLAGARSVLVLTGDGRTELEKSKTWPYQPDFVAENLLAAVEWVFGGKDAG